MTTSTRDILPRLKSRASSRGQTKSDLHIVPNSTTTALKSKISKSDIISKGVNSGLSNPTKKMKKNNYLNVSVRSHPTSKECGFSHSNDKK